VKARVRGASALLAVVASIAAVSATLPAVSPAAATSSDYALATQTLPDGHKVVARWDPCRTITYSVNARYAAGKSSHRNAAIRDVQAAFARASVATGINFKYVGSTTQIPTNTSANRWYERQNSAEIVVSWVRQGSSASRSSLLSRVGRGSAAGTGGYAFKYWKVTGSPWTGVTGRGFVVLDGSQIGTFKAGFGSGSTRGALLLHEIGHSLGLLHVGSTSQVMYPTVLPRSYAGYATGDRNGLRHLGTASGCVNAPGWVWTDLS